MGPEEVIEVKLAQLARAARATQVRLGLADSSRQLVKWLPIHVLFLTPWALFYRFDLISGQVFWSGSALSFVVLTSVVLRSFARRPGLLTAALCLDDAHNLRGTLSAALDFSGMFAGTGSLVSEGRGGSHAPGNGYRELALQKAGTLGALSPARAAPLVVPKGAGLGALMLGLWLVLVWVPERQVSVQVPRSSQGTAADKEVWVSQDDAELLQRDASELEQVAQTAEGKEVAARFNEIVLRAVSGEIDQAEAFRLAAELEADLQGAAHKAGALHDGLKKRGEALAERRVTREVGQALKDGRYKDAEEALKKLAQRLSSGETPLSKQELEELRQSLEKARSPEVTKNSSTRDEQAKAEQESLEKERERLLKKKQDKQGLSATEQEKLDQTERRLKTLDRQKKESEKEQQEEQTLSELDRALQEAAKELQNEQKKSGDYLDQAAESVKQGTQKKLSDEEKRELLKQLKSLKERLRRQNQDGKRAERMRKFQERARGQEGQEGQPEQQGGKPGQQGEMRLGPGGAKIPVPGQAPGGKGKPQAGGEPSDEPGSGMDPGKGHDPNLTGEATDLPGAELEDKLAVAEDSGAGESASETILSVAEEGFTSSSYEKLYQEYETVAEEVMEKDAIPPGRKDHVLRYFELIRPRKSSGSQKEQQ